MPVPSHNRSSGALEIRHVKGVTEAALLVVSPCVDFTLGPKALVEPLPPLTIILHDWLIGHAELMADES